MHETQAAGSTHETRGRPKPKKKAAHDAASFLNQILEFGTHLGLGEKQERTLTMSMTFGT